jgi:dihydrofolate reductase
VRLITAAFFISVDGVVEAPQNWHLPYLSPELAAEVETQQVDAGALLLGRRTYEEWAAYWPQQDRNDPLARRLNSIPTFVVSRTLGDVAWEASELLPGDAVEAVARLAAGDGSPIALAGSPTLFRGLLEAGLVDELRLVVHPLVVGTGQRLFGDASHRVALALEDVQLHANGVAVLVYRPHRS